MTDIQIIIAAAGILIRADKAKLLDLRAEIDNATLDFMAMDQAFAMIQREIELEMQAELEE